MSPATSKSTPPIAVENVNVKIMGRDYVFACSPDERASLMECVAIVDRKMTTIRTTGKLTAIDRIAVMAALTIANEFTTLRDAASPVAISGAEGLDFASLGPTINSLNNAIGEFLKDVEPQLAASGRNTDNHSTDNRSTDNHSLALPFSPRSNTP
jgi:cell division protein ZapA